MAPAVILRNIPSPGRVRSDSGTSPLLLILPLLWHRKEDGNQLERDILTLGSILWTPCHFISAIKGQGNIPSKMHFNITCCHFHTHAYIHVHAVYTHGKMNLRVASFCNGFSCFFPFIQRNSKTQNRNLM